jgi:hypothetical protein
LEYSKTVKQKPYISQLTQPKPAKESKPKPKKQPKTNPEQKPPAEGGYPIFTSKFQHKYGLEMPADRQGDLIATLKSQGKDGF